MAIRKSEAKADGISYEVIEECGTVAKRKGGYELKLRFMAWNGKEAKYDLRPWKVDDEGNETCGKGIGLSGEELEALGKMIAEMGKE